MYIYIYISYYIIISLSNPNEIHLKFQLLMVKDPQKTAASGVPGTDALDSLLKPKERLAPLGAPLAPLAPLGAPLAPLAPLGGDALDSLMGPKATLLPRNLGTKVEPLVNWMGLGLGFGVV